MEEKEIKNQEEDLNIERNIKRLMENRLINPKFVTQMEVAKSLGLSEKTFYNMVNYLRIDSKDLSRQRMLKRNSLKRQGLLK